MPSLPPLTLKTYLQLALILFVTVFVFGAIVEYGMDYYANGSAEIDWVKSLLISLSVAIFVPFLNHRLAK